MTKTAERVLVVSSWGMAGAEMPRQAAAVHCMLEDLRLRPVTGAFGAAAFAEHPLHATDAAGPERAVIYLRALSPGLGGTWAAVRWTVAAASRRPRVVLVSGGEPLGLRAAAWALRAVMPWRVRVARLSQGPRRAVKYLTGQRPMRPDPATAERATFDTIVRRTSRRPRLAPGHILRAAALDASLGSARRDLEAVARLVAHPEAEALARGREPWGAASLPPIAPALAAALRGSRHGAAAALARPLGCRRGALSVAEIFQLLVLRPQVPDGAALDRPWTAPAFREAVRVDREAPARVLTSGLGTASTGLGRNEEMSKAALALAGLNRARLLRGAVIHHGPAERLRQAIVEADVRRDAVQIGFLLWEYSVLSAAQRRVAALLDEIWVPTRFLLEAFASAAACPVRVMGKGIEVPDLPAMPRRDGPVRFLLCLDFHSSVERKNPLAAVRAVRRAFRPGEAVLTVKSTPGPARHWGDPHRQMDRIRRIAAADSRICLIEARIPDAQMFDMVARTDALLSTHRAEGFGYFPAFARMLGVPAVATDYSGTRDFIDDAYAYPVPFRMVPARATPVPLQGAQWADVDGAALVDVLRTIAADPMAARAKAAAGQAEMRARYSMEGLAERYARRLRSLGVSAERATGS